LAAPAGNLRVARERGGLVALVPGDASSEATHCEELGLRSGSCSLGSTKATPVIVPAVAAALTPLTSAALEAWLSEPTVHPVAAAVAVGWVPGGAALCWGPGG
jgi:hypothetical protein